MIAWVRGEGAASVVHLVGNLLDLLSNEVVSGHTDTAVSVPVVERVSRAGDARTSDSDVSDFTETAVLEVVLIEAAIGRNKWVTGLRSGIIDSLKGTLGAAAVNNIVALSANTGLLVHIVDFVIDAGLENAGTVDEGVS